MSDPNNSGGDALKRTPLHAFHQAHGVRMVPFAGYEMPVQYAGGILEEHRWTRSNASLFDIGHMGEVHLSAADGRHDTIAIALETLVPADVVGMKVGHQRYTQLLNDDGGIIDDLMMTRLEDADGSARLVLILNASRKDVDCAHLAARLPSDVRMDVQQERTLVAVQGPRAAEVMSVLSPLSTALRFMQATRMPVAGVDCLVSRSGYTGEDGFELSIPATDAVSLAEAILSSGIVRPAGLGARDSLRLEAGLSLYGHELDEQTSPIEAGLGWSIQRRRLDDGRFPAAQRIRDEVANGTRRLRVGIAIDDRIPARQGYDILSADGETIGVVTSGTFSPTLNHPIAMGYVTPEFAAPVTKLSIRVRANTVSARVVALPFVPHRYLRSPPRTS